MKVAAIFVIYNPNIEELRNNVLKIVDDVDTVILWLNSKTEINLPENISHKIVYLGDGTNYFISKPLNIALSYCIENGFDYLLTMDQDSEWEDLGGFLGFIKSNPRSDAIAYAPNVNGGRKSKEDYLELETVITSGTLYDVKATSALDGFREDYEIYWVDGEFSYWARHNGYKLYCLPKFKLKHQFGGSTKKVLGFRGANYSPLVYYYMFRNMLWMHREFGVKAVSYKTILYTMKLFIPGIILCEDRKIKKLWNIKKAFLHGFFKPINRRKT